MVRASGYIYNADIWASVVGKNFEKWRIAAWLSLVPRSLGTRLRLAGGILADRCCSVN